MAHGDCLGREAAVRTGLEQCSGEIVFLRDERPGLAVDGIPKLWRAAQEHPVAADRSETPSGAKWARFSAGHTTRQAGYLMIDRRSAEPAHGPSRPAPPNFLARLRTFALGE